MTEWLQYLGVALIAAGALLTMITALGMIRLASLFARMHAATKPQSLGLAVMCMGLALVLQEPRAAATLSLVVMMQLVAAPISAHMLARAVYRLGQVDRDVIVMDEYAEDIRRATQRLEENPDTTLSQPAVRPEQH